MGTINIPASIEQAVDVLVGVEALLRAKEWERAAIVAAFVTVSEQGVGANQVGKVKTDLSPAEFADLGIAGLKSKNTVQEYAKRWEEAGRARPSTR